MSSIIKIVTTARQLWPLYLGIVIGAVAISAAALLGPFLVARATDTVIAIVDGQTHQLGWLFGLAVLLLLVNLLNSALTNLVGYWGDLMAARLRAILSQRYFHKLLRLPQHYFDNELSGKIISRLNRSITAITDFLKMLANSFFPLLLTLAASLGIAAYYSPWLALLLIIIYPSFVWVTALTSKRWQVWEHRKNEHLDIAGGRFAEVVGQMRVVKSFATERLELARFSQHHDATIELTRQQSAFWHRMDLLRRAVLDLVFFGVYAIIFFQAAHGAYSIGVMVMLIQLVAMARMPVESMSWLVDTTQHAITGSREYFEAMAEEDEPHHQFIETGASEVAWRDEAAAVTFEGVNFRYADSDELVLKDINLTIAQGERIAFVGESGGGKTTLVNLIMKLHPVTSGRLYVSGQAVDEVPTAALRRRVGVVFQDAALFSGTVRENLAYGMEATDEQLAEAARRANADFIYRLPDGFDTEIGERGVKLSGGQKQRISVGRALLKDAPILILDEATSALDTKAERAVQAGLEELMAGRTTLIIAHRLSTISTVDRIVTLRDGRIDEVGTPAELAASNGIYAELLALQGSTSKKDKAKLLRYDITH